MGQFVLSTCTKTRRSRAGAWGSPVVAHPAVLILGYSEAAMYIRGPSAADVNAIISIYGQREYPLDVEGLAHALILRFDDTEAPNEDDPIHAYQIRLRQRKAAEIGLELIPPTLDHARSIIEFARSISSLEGTLLCQCHAGISRSPAAALLCLATWTRPGQEQACVARIRAARPAAVPHHDLVAFGDRLLQRNGNLLASIEEPPETGTR